LPKLAVSIDIFNLLFYIGGLSDLCRVCDSILYYSILHYTVLHGNKKGWLIREMVQRTNTENLKQLIPEKELCGQSQFPNLYVCERFIYSHDRSAYSAAENMWTDPWNIYFAHRHMNVERDWGQFLFRWEYINGFSLQCSH
jgi:hypothetical protein